MSARPRRAPPSPSALAALLLALAFAGCGPRDVQSPEALAGHYEGNIAWRDQTMPVDLDIALVEGRPVVRATLPALLSRDVPVEGFAFRSPNVRFELPVGDEAWTFDGWFRRGAFSGTFSGGSLPRTLNRNTLPRLGLRRIERRAPAETTADTVRFAGGSGPLAGTVFAPADTLAHPAVVVLAQGEDGSRAGALELAARYARAGFVALAYDARGTGASAGRAEATLADHELDAAEAAGFLSGHPRCDGQVGLFGSGRGAVLAPRVATRVRTAFVAAVSPPTGPLRAHYEQRGAVPAWVQGEPGADAAAPWGAITAPALAFFGQRGRFPARESALRLARTFAESGVPGRIEIVERADHALRVAPGYGEPYDFPRFAPAALDTLLAWSRRQAGLPPELVVLAPPRR